MWVSFFLFAGVTAIVEHCPYLQVIYLRRCLQIGDEAIIRLSECCSHIRDLNIGGCRNVTDRSLEALGRNSSHLRSLNIGHANVSKSVLFRHLFLTHRSTERGDWGRWDWAVCWGELSTVDPPLLHRWSFSNNFSEWLDTNRRSCLLSLHTRRLLKPERNISATKKNRMNQNMTWQILFCRSQMMAYLAWWMELVQILFR